MREERNEEVEIPMSPSRFVCERSERHRGIIVDGLVKEYDGGVRAVDGVRFAIEPGDVFGLLGPNGSGKTTTVKMLTTLLAPSDGRAMVAGFDVVREAAAVRASIGAALQEVALDPLLNAWDHMHLQGTLHGMSSAHRRARAEELIDRVGLSEAAGRKVRTYSGGMRRRLDLALALVHDPSILFLDEPTTGLDPQSRTAVWDEVRRLAHEEGVAVFLTTQYLEEADVLADYVAILDRGRIVAEGTPGELKARIGEYSVVVTPANGQVEELRTVMSRFGRQESGPGGAVRCRVANGVTDLATIVRSLDAEHIAVASIELHTPTLDDVFLAETGRQLEGESRSQ